MIEYHLLSAVRDSLFSIFAATFHIWRPSPPSVTRGPTKQGSLIWVVTTCSDVVGSQRFGRPLCLHLQGEDGGSMTFTSLQRCENRESHMVGIYRTQNPMNHLGVEWCHIAILIFVSYGSNLHSPVTFLCTKFPKSVQSMSCNATRVAVWPVPGPC
jgi:hypothetical protein